MSASALVTLILYGLVAFGQIHLRRIDGYQQLPAFIAKEWQATPTRFGMGPAARLHHRISVKFRCGPKDHELFAPQRVNGTDPSRADCRQPYCN